MVNKSQIKQAIKLLKSGKLVVLPTDTIYGISAQAKNPKAVEKIYQLKKRDLNKPCILLISKIADLKDFGLDLNSKVLEILEQIWPNKVSVVLPVNSLDWSYLHRGSFSLAFRVPKNDLLQQILKQTGPLVSTSVNPSFQKPATNITEAKNYFQDKVSLYLDNGNLTKSASTVVTIEDNQIKVLRPGDIKL